jgi:hypothetical protein
MLGVGVVRAAGGPDATQLAEMLATGSGDGAALIAPDGTFPQLSI